MLVTIGIPLYNAEKHIRKAIDSVLNQSYKEFEVIITNDGSTDKSADIVKEYKDERIIFINSKENKGIAYRLNQQINLAKGKYFFRMDADDIMKEDRIEKQIKVLNSSDSIDVIGSSAIVIDDCDNTIGIRTAHKGTISNEDSIYDVVSKLKSNGYNVFPVKGFIHPTVAGRIEWFKKWMYREDYSGCEDADLWYRSMKQSCFLQLEDPLLYYRDPLKYNIKSAIRRKLTEIRMLFDRRTVVSSLRIAKALFCIPSMIIIHYTGLESLYLGRRNSKI